METIKFNRIGSTKEFIRKLFFDQMTAQREIFINNLLSLSLSFQRYSHWSNTTRLNEY